MGTATMASRQLPRDDDHGAREQDPRLEQLRREAEVNTLAERLAKKGECT
jgi:hypothetical protein